MIEPGLAQIQGFVKVYDPNNGKTYCGKLTLKGNAIDLRGFICSMSMLGRTSQWTLAE